MKMDYPQIEYATYISYSSEDSPLKLESGGEKIEARMCWATDDFFKIFGGFKFTEGSAETAFTKPDKLFFPKRPQKRFSGNSRLWGKYSSAINTQRKFIRLVVL